MRRRHVRVPISFGCDSSVEAQVCIGEKRFGYMTGAGIENETFVNA